MLRLVTAKQMKYLDDRTIEYHKVPSMVLMERASLAVVKHLNSFDLTRTLVVCGSGNNGGDGIAIARLLHLSGKSVDQYFVGKRETMSEGCRAQMDIAFSYGVSWINNPDFSEYTTIVDAVFGVGLSRAIAGIYADVIHNMNASNAKIVSVDIPSGISADNGKVLGCAVEADMTVSFAYRKVGHMLYPGKTYCGRLVIEDIGIYEKDNQLTSDYFMVEERDLSYVPIRKVNGNKGTFGKVLLIAGSKDMPGASILSGQAIMRTGAGMLRIVAPMENREILAASIPEAILDIYESSIEAIQRIEKGLLWADVVVLGPGLGTGDIAKDIVEYVLKTCNLPLVIDADGLNIISKNKGLLFKNNSPCIITPHVGEMARLTDCSVSDVSTDILDTAKTFARKYQVQCVLKDAATCIAMPDGTTYINGNGNSGMATAGSGDVLTGIIGGLLAVGVDWKYAGALGVYIHGYCGDKLKNKYGAAYIVAGDLIGELTCLRLGEEK